MDGDPQNIYQAPRGNLSDAEVLNAVITGYLYFNVLLSRTDSEPVTMTAQTVLEIDTIIARMQSGQIYKVWTNVNGSRANTRFAPSVLPDLQAIRTAFSGRWGSSTNDGNFKPF